MTARSAAAGSSLVVAGGLALAGCTDFYEIPIETPIQPKMDVTAFQRVLVAGFISGGTDDVDANLETVRLLRSQLRTKSPLRVIEADVLPLAEIAATESNAARDNGDAITTDVDRRDADGRRCRRADMAPPARGADAEAGSAQADRRRRSSNEKDLAKYRQDLRGRRLLEEARRGIPERR